MRINNVNLRLASLIYACLCASLAAVAGADIVYTKDGGRHEGTVTRDGIHVIVETEDGQTVTLEAKDVLHIAVVSDTDEPDTPTPEPPHEPATPDEPEETPDEPADEPPEAEDLPEPPSSGFADSGNVVPAAITFSMDRITMPESAAFVFMRRLKTAPPGQETHDLRDQIKVWQAAAHDRLRRRGSSWVKPGQFTLRRQEYYEQVEKIEAILKDIERIDDDDENAEAERKKLQRELAHEAEGAAELWIDDDMRAFMLGVAYYQLEQYDDSYKHFKQARESNPLIAAYHQGAGMALRHIDKGELASLAALTDALLLRPDDPAAVRAVDDAIKKVPGLQADDNMFRRAQELLGTYPEDWLRKPTRSKQFTWLMPGDRGWTVRDHYIPEPPYDRLVVRQAMAAAIDKTTLLVDAAVVESALDVLVRIDGDTIAIGRVGKVARGQQTHHKKLALVSVVGYTFTPMAVSADAIFEVGDEVETYGVNVLAEMGTEVRPVRTTLVQAAPHVQPAERLAAGESAAPVVTADRRLVGMLSGRTRVRAEQGGPGKFIPRVLFDDLLAKRSRYRYQSSYGTRSRRPITWRKAEGDHFIIYGVFGEKID